MAPHLLVNGESIKVVNGIIYVRYRSGRMLVLYAVARGSIPSQVIPKT